MKFIKNFFKKLFCIHVWNPPIQTSRCKSVCKCSICGKKKTFYYHEYKEVKKFLVEHYSGALIGQEQRWLTMKVIYQCSKCGDIFSKEFNV